MPPLLPAAVYAPNADTVLTHYIPRAWCGGQVLGSHEQRCHHLFSFCTLLRLLAAGGAGGGAAGGGEEEAPPAVRLHEVLALAEDVWLLSSSLEKGEKLSLLLSQARFGLLQQAGRAVATHRDVFEGIVASLPTQDSGGAAVATARGHGQLTVAEVAYVLSRCVGLSDASVMASGRVIRDDVAAAVVRFATWSAGDAVRAVDADALKELLCTLGSYRTLQVRLPGSVPGAHQRVFWFPTHNPCSPNPLPRSLSLPSVVSTFGSERSQRCNDPSRAGTCLAFWTPLGGAPACRAFDNPLRRLPSSRTLF